jgi:hypothetical protein
MFSSALRSSAFIVIASAGHDNAQTTNRTFDLVHHVQHMLTAIHRTHLALAPDIESLLF